MDKRFLTDTPEEPEVEAAGYGFAPAIELRREPPVAGELIGVDAEGNVVEHWAVKSNDSAVAYLAGKRVALVQDCPQMLKRLQAAGCQVQVPPRSYTLLERAQIAAGDSIFWI